MFKAVVFVCAHALLIQSISAQWCGAPFAGAPFTAAPMAAGPCAAAWYEAPYAGAPLANWAYAPASTLAASNGPGLAISSASPLLPAGVSVLSENAYEGALAVGGALPFLGTIALEGLVPTAGAGAISYGCGNGAVAITAEDGYMGTGCPLGYGAGYAGGLTCPLGYGAGLAAPLAMEAGFPGPIGYGPGYAGMGPYGCGAIY